MSNDDTKTGDEKVDWSLLETRIGRIVDERMKESERAMAGGGGSGGSMDAWQQSVENRLNNIQAEILDVRNEIRAVRSDMWSQFRWLLGVLVPIMIGGFGTLLWVMARGFGWL